MMAAASYSLDELCVIGENTDQFDEDQTENFAKLVSSCVKSLLKNVKKFEKQIIESGKHLEGIVNTTYNRNNNRVEQLKNELNKTEQNLVNINEKFSKIMYFSEIISNKSLSAGRNLNEEELEQQEEPRTVNESIIFERETSISEPAENFELNDLVETMLDWKIKPENKIDASEVYNEDQSISSLDVDLGDQIDTSEIADTTPIMHNTPGLDTNVVSSRLCSNVVMPIHSPNVNTPNLVPNIGAPGLFPNVGVSRPSPTIGVPRHGAYFGAPRYVSNFGMPPFGHNAGAHRLGLDVNVPRLGQIVPNHGFQRFSHNFRAPGFDEYHSMNQNFGMQPFGQHVIRPRLGQNVGGPRVGQKCGGPRLGQDIGGPRRGQRFGHNMSGPRSGQNTGQKTFGQNMDGLIVGPNVIGSRIRQNVVEPRVEQNAVEPRVEQNAIEPKVEQNVVEPRVEQNVVEPRVEQNVIELRVEQNVEPGVEQNVVEPVSDQNVSDPSEIPNDGLVFNSEKEDCYSWVCYPPYHDAGCIPLSYQ